MLVITPLLLDIPLELSNWGSDSGNNVHRAEWRRSHLCRMELISQVVKAGSGKWGVGSEKKFCMWVKLEDDSS